MLNSETVAILGATSAVAQELAKLYARQAANLILCARNGEKLKALQNDLCIRGATSVSVVEQDFDRLDELDAFTSKLFSLAPKIDVALIAYGTLISNGMCERDPTQAQTLMVNNYNSPSLLSLLLAQRMASLNSPCVIAVVSSVAGDRGRQSNFIYGSAKGGLSLFLQGLRNRYFSTGVHVLTVKPGFIDSPMTADIKKNLLFVSPERVAKEIKWAIKTKKDVLYTPSFWRFIMLLIKLIPETVFKRLKL